MRYFLVFILSLLMLSAVCSAQSYERLYVVQWGDESLAEINLATGNVTAHAVDLGYGCNDICISGSRIYVANSLINTLQEIDAQSNHTVRDLPMVGGLNPYSVASLNSDTLLVTHFRSNNVLLIRLSDGAIAGRIPVGIAPEGIVVSGDYFFVCCTGYSQQGYDPGTVHVFNRGTLLPVDTLQVGLNPQFAAVDHRNRLHVVCTGNYSEITGEIHVFALSDLQRDTILAIGGTPSRVSFGGGYAFLAAGGWSGSGSVFRYSLESLQLLNGPSNPIQTSTGAYDVAALPNGSFFISCSGADVVEQRDATGGLIRSFLVSSNPGYIALYRTDNVQNTLKIYDKDYNYMCAYPNPFNGVVNFKLHSQNVMHYNINIYNKVGQLVDRLSVPAGTSVIQWNSGARLGNSLSSGVYYVTVPGFLNADILKIALIK
ncbi:hypothetical protein EHM69_06425 [candidate division KSB1 bacterium]|nr:MAG: hypothetical protein EHM69_06425 [candidate division KSB1 bacterium]